MPLTRTADRRVERRTNNVSSRDRVCEKAPSPPTLLRQIITINVSCPESSRVHVIFTRLLQKRKSTVSSGTHHSLGAYFHNIMRHHGCICIVIVFTEE